MTAIDRTAYPNLGKALKREELIARHSLSDVDREFISQTLEAKLVALQ